MNTSKYGLEFDGQYYWVMRGNHAVAAFATLEEAYHVMRNFEDKPLLSARDKIPPATRLAKLQYYGV